MRVAAQTGKMLRINWKFVLKANFNQQPDLGMLKQILPSNYKVMLLKSYPRSHKSHNRTYKEWLVSLLTHCNITIEKVNSAILTGQNMKTWKFIEGFILQRKSVRPLRL